ncbi:MAG TPA: hypothetical protein VF384_10010 [Planctomycetota bacterium]
MRRGSLWLPIAGTVFLLVLGGMECVSSSQAPVRERIAQFVAEFDAQQAALPPREALYGETLAGNACDDYAAASKSLAAAEVSWRQLPRSRDWTKELTLRRKPLSDAARCTIAPALDQALRSIRQGTRRANVRPRDHRVDFLLLDAVIEDATRRAFAARDGRLLAELFLDQWTLRGDMCGHAWTQSPAFRDEWLPVLGPEAAAWFASVLQRLDERTPLVASARRYIATGARDVADLTPMQQSFTQGLQAWNYGFDSYWRSLVVCDRLRENLGELEPPAQDWSKRQAQIDVFGSVIDEPAGAWVDAIPCMVHGEERFRRQVLANLRLLRLAVAFMHGLELPQLADPLGPGIIEVEIRENEATFSGEGANGKERLSRTVCRR